MAACLFWLAAIMAMRSCYIFLSFLRSSSLNCFMRLLFSSISLWFWRRRCRHICSKSFCLVFIYWICLPTELWDWLYWAYTAILSSFSRFTLRLMFLRMLRFPLLKYSFSYTFYPSSWRILRKPYMFNWRINEEKLLCLKNRGNIVYVNWLMLFIWKESFEFVQEIIWLIEES